MAKIKNDAYFTPLSVAKYCIERTFNEIGEENISETIEPSAGNGVFSLNIPYGVCWAYDIEPQHESITRQDFLEVEEDYLLGRLIIGNPPFMKNNTGSVKFFKKAIKLGDYVAFIQPISQLDNNRQMYEFDLIYSEDLGFVRFSDDRELHVCFNIYKRPENEELNSKPKLKLKDISFVEYRRGGNTKIQDNYDYVIGTFGAGCVGKVPTTIGQYSLEMYIYIKNEKLKDKILNVIKNTDWKSLSKGISGTYRLPQWRFIEILKEKIPELQ